MDWQRWREPRNSPPPPPDRFSFGPQPPTSPPLPPCPSLPRPGGENQLRSTICQLPLETFNSNKIYGPSFQRILPVKSISWRSRCKRRPLFSALWFTVWATPPGLWGWGELGGNGYERRTCASVFTSGRSRVRDLILLCLQGQATIEADNCRDIKQISKWTSPEAHKHWPEKNKRSHH